MLSFGKHSRHFKLHLHSQKLARKQRVLFLARETSVRVLAEDERLRRNGRREYKRERERERERHRKSEWICSPFAACRKRIGSRRRPWIGRGMQIETGHEYSNVQLILTRRLRENRHSVFSHRAQ